MKNRASNDLPLWQRLLLRRLRFLTIVAVLAGGGMGLCYAFAPQWLMQGRDAWQAQQAHLAKHEVEAGDTRWVYYEGGQGPILLLLHGFASDKTVWLEQAKLLTANFHLIIPDLPGWGESSQQSQGNYDIDAQAARLKQFVAELRLDRFLLIGHSMGGAIAGVYAADYPDHVAGLALIAPFGLNMRENAFAKESLAGQDPFVFDDHAGFERMAKLVFHQVPEIPGRFIDVLITRNQQSRAFIDASFAQLNHPEQYLSLQHRLARLRVPVLGLWCQDDQVIDISALDSLRQGLSHAPAISTSVLRGCNHVPILEKPEETARVLSSFAIGH